MSTDQPSNEQVKLDEWVEQQRKCFGVQDEAEYQALMQKYEPIPAEEVKRIAFHEAGHIVADLFDPPRVSFVTVRAMAADGSPGGLSRASESPMEMWYAALQWSDSAPKSKNQLSQECVPYLAGLAAEGCVHPSTHFHVLTEIRGWQDPASTGSSDWQYQEATKACCVAYRYLVRAGQPPAEAIVNSPPFVEEQYETASALVHARWAAVKAVAERLIQVRTLLGSEARRIIEDHTTNDPQEEEGPIHG